MEWGAVAEACVRVHVSVAQAATDPASQPLATGGLHGQRHFAPAQGAKGR